MPKGPRGEKRPADVVGAAVKVMKIAEGREIPRHAKPTVDTAECMYSSPSLIGPRPHAR